MTPTDVVLIVNHINSHPNENTEVQATDTLFAEGEFTSASDLNGDLLNLLVADSMSGTKKKQ